MSGVEVYNIAGSQNHDYTTDTMQKENEMQEIAALIAKATSQATEVAQNYIPR